MRIGAVVTVLLVTTAGFIGLARSGGGAMAQGEEPPFTTDFRLADCQFKMTGANPYFTLEPGYRLVLESEGDGETTRLVITVLNKTQKILLPRIGEVNTRVVEERKTVDGELVEIKSYAVGCGVHNLWWFRRSSRSSAPSSPAGAASTTWGGLGASPL